MDEPELSCTALDLTSHHSSKEGQLWRGLQTADGLAGGELAGKVGTGATLQTPAEPQGSGEVSPVEWHYTPAQSLPHRTHPELSCTLGRSRGTHSTKEGITSHTSHCWKGKIDHLLLWQQELLQTGKVMESGVLKAEGNKGRISSEKEGLMFAL